MVLFEKGNFFQESGRKKVLWNASWIKRVFAEVYHFWSINLDGFECRMFYDWAHALIVGKSVDKYACFAMVLLVAVLSAISRITASWSTANLLRNLPKYLFNRSTSLPLQRFTACTCFDWDCSTFSTALLFLWNILLNVVRSGPMRVWIVAPFFLKQWGNSAINCFNCDSEADWKMTDPVSRMSFISVALSDAAVDETAFSAKLQRTAMQTTTMITADKALAKCMLNMRGRYWNALCFYGLLRSTARHSQAMMHISKKDTPWRDVYFVVVHYSGSLFESKCPIGNAMNYR